MKSVSPQPRSIQMQNPNSSRANYYTSSQVTPPKNTPIKGPPGFLTNQMPYAPVETAHRLPITPTDSRFFPIPLVRSISPTIVARPEYQTSRSNSPYIIGYRNGNGTPIKDNNFPSGAHVVSTQGPNNVGVKQRVFNVSNVGRENKHRADMNMDRNDLMNPMIELEKVKERNSSLTKKLQILEDIVGNSGLEIMEQKINKLINENDRLTSILQENRGVSNRPSPSQEKCQPDQAREIERLNKIIQNQAKEVEVWKKRWNDAERTSLQMSQNVSNAGKDQPNDSDRTSNIIKEKSEEIENLNQQIKNFMENANMQELEHTKKVTILLQENDKLNAILNRQIDELDKLAIRYQELESRQMANSVFEAKFETIQRELAQNNKKMNQLLQENEYLMQKIKEQDKDLASIKVLEQKIEMVVEENIKNNNILKMKVDECEFLKKKVEEEQFNLEFLEKENTNQKLFIEELKAKINILIDENKKLNDSVTLKIGENIALAALEEKVEILVEENRKLNELNGRMTEKQNKSGYRPEEATIYKEKAEFLENKNIMLAEEVEKTRSEMERILNENQQIGEIEMKTELLIEENSNLNNLLAQKDEEIFYLRSKLMGQNGIQSNGNN